MYRPSYRPQLRLHSLKSYLKHAKCYARLPLLSLVVLNSAIVPRPLHSALLLYDYLTQQGFTVNYNAAAGELRFAQNHINGKLIIGFPFLSVGNHLYSLPHAPRPSPQGNALPNDETSARFKKIIAYYLKQLPPPNQTPPPSENVLPRTPPTQRLVVPQPPPFVPTQNTTKRIHTIILDPGHGGRDPGASAFGFKEKNLVLAFTKELAVATKKRLPNITVLLTRKQDVFLSIIQRSQIANKTLKRNQNALFVSIHLNAWFHGNARGYEVYYLANDSAVFTAKAQRHIKYEPFFFPYQQPDIRKAFAFLYTIQYARESALLAQKMFAELKQKLPTYAHAAEVKSDTFYVLKGTLMPSILIELGYITNENDLAFILNPTSRAKLLATIVTVIADYTQLFTTTHGFTENYFNAEKFLTPHTHTPP